MRILCAMLMLGGMVRAQVEAPLAKAPPEKVPQAQASQTDAPSLSEQKGMLALISGSALRYFGKVPEFTCTELVTRSEATVRGPDRTHVKWKQRDTLEEVLRFVGRRENHTLVLVNARPTRFTHDSLEGMRSDGLLRFVMVPTWIFGTRAKTRFDWVRWDMRNGHRVAVFLFNVPASISTKPLANESHAYLVGYHGLIWADPDTGEMARLEAQIDAPPDFPFQEDNFEIDYGSVDMSGSPFLLPVKAMGLVRDGKMLTKNEIEFTNYQKYEAEIKLTFGDPNDPGPD